MQMLGNNDPDNEITLTAFRLLTLDLLELFKTMNEGTINVLGNLLHSMAALRSNIKSRALL
jgi:ANTH domain